MNLDHNYNILFILIIAFTKNYIMNILIVRKLIHKSHF